MGTIHHHAIVVTSYDGELTRKVHQVAVRIGGNVSPVSYASTNGYTSFCVFPDGSKEYWSESDEADGRRKELIKYIDSLAYEDGSNTVEYAHISFGELADTIETNCDA